MLAIAFSFAVGVGVVGRSNQIRVSTPNSIEFYVYGLRRITEMSGCDASKTQ